MKHSQPWQPKADGWGIDYNDQEEMKEEEDSRVSEILGDMEIGELASTAAPRLSADSMNSLLMWHPSGQFI